MPIDVDIAYHLEKQAAELSITCVEWQSRVRPIPCAWEMPDSWGPSPTDIARAAQLLYHAKVLQPLNGDLWEFSEDEGGDDVDEAGDDDELMAAMEEIAYANQYRIVDSDSEGDLEYWDEVHVPSSPTFS